MAAKAVEHGFEFREFAAIAVGHGDYGDGDHPWHQLERGEIELHAYEQAVDSLAKERGHDGFPPLVDLILSQVLVVRPAMLELLGDLRARGAATAILTNNVRDLGRSTYRANPPLTVMARVSVDCDRGARIDG